MSASQFFAKKIIKKNNENKYMHPIGTSTRSLKDPSLTQVDPISEYKKRVKGIILYVL